MLRPFYKTRTNYSLTLNPIDKHQFFGKPDRLRKFRSFVYENLLCFKCKYHLEIELSEPRGFQLKGYAGPRLHLHGWFSFATKRELAEFLMTGYYNLTRWTSVDIDTINDLPKWKGYCSKQKLIKDNTLTNFELQPNKFT